MRRPLALLASAALVLLAPVSWADSGQPGGLGPEAAGKIKRWLGQPSDEAYRWGPVQVERWTLEVGLIGPEGESGSLELSPRPDDDKSPGSSFQMKARSSNGKRAGIDALEEGITRIREADDGRFYGEALTIKDHGASQELEREKPVPGARDVIPERPSPPPDESDWYPAIQSGMAAMVLLVMLLVWLLALRNRGEALTVRTLVRPEILVPMTLQTTLLTYWSLYWGDVVAHIPTIAATLAFGLALDLILRIAIRGEGLFHLAVFPVVLSMHLFVWFQREGFWLGFLVVAIALTSKVAFKRDGRHIFNPSALGIAAVGVLCYVWPDTFTYVDIAHAFNVAPNMFELVIACGLVAQLRVPIVLVSIGAALVQWVLILAAGPDVQIPSVHWAPVTLAVVLLATDPATIPRTGAGRVLFGGLYSLLMISSSIALESNGISDFFTKVLPLPICNYLVPHLDRFGEHLPERVRSWLAPELNRRHVIAWLILMLLPWWSWQMKETFFEGRFHAHYGTRHVQLRDDTARCEDNPVFCAPLSILDEIGLWSDAPSP